MTVESRQRRAVHASSSDLSVPQHLVCHPVTHLEILDESFEESNEMFRFADIPRNSFIQHVLRQYYLVSLDLVRRSQKTYLDSKAYPHLP